MGRGKYATFPESSFWCMHQHDMRGERGVDTIIITITILLLLHWTLSERERESFG